LHMMRLVVWHQEGGIDLNLIEHFPNLLHLSIGFVGF